MLKRKKNKRIQLLSRIYRSFRNGRFRSQADDQYFE